MESIVVRIVIINLSTVGFFVLYWLMLDLTVIYAPEKFGDWAKSAMNILVTMPFVSFVITYLNLKTRADLGTTKSLAIGILVGLVMIPIGMFTLMVCGSAIHLWIGGAI